MKRQIVITLYDDEYNSIMDYGLILEADRNIFAQAIKNGVPLPKGHGRLIDADVLVNGMEDDYEFCEAVNATPTIIKADAESEK